MKNNIPQHLRKSAGIYEIRNTVNGKAYIGSTNNFTKRASTHKSQLLNSERANPHLQSAYIKYGSDAFVFTPLCEVKKLLDESSQSYRNRLLLVEQEYADRLNTTNPRTGYNIRIEVVKNTGLSITNQNPKNKRLGDHEVRVAKFLIGRGFPKRSVALYVGANGHVGEYIEHGGFAEVVLSQSDIDKFVASGVEQDFAKHHEVRKKEHTQKRRKHNVGSACVTSKLTDAEVIKIKELLMTGSESKSISERFGIPVATIYAIRSGRQWGELTGISRRPVTRQRALNPPNCIKCGSDKVHSKGLCNSCYAYFRNNPDSRARPVPKLPSEKLLQIKDRLLAGETCKVIAKDFAVSESMIAHIKSGACWGKITGITRYKRPDQEPPTIVSKTT